MVPYTRPDGHYDERLRSIDEQICELMQRRKQIAGEEPGRPFNATVAEWAEKYGLYEAFLHSIFGTMAEEEIYKPQVKPEGFRHQIPVLRSAEQDGVFYSIATARQYGNASVVVLSADWEEEEVYERTGERPFHRQHREMVLEIAGDRTYECRTRNGSGTTGKMSQNYVIIPALPDDLSGIEFRLRIYEGFRKETPLGEQMVLSGIGGL